MCSRFVVERSRQNLATVQSRIPAESAASGQKVAAPYLVVGADSLVGGSLIKALQSAGQGVVGTTRRRASMGPGRFYLDFQNSESYRLPVPASYAFIVAAATNYDRCETDPSARKINVEQTPRLVESLLSQGLFVTLISTNSVFGGNEPGPTMRIRTMPASLMPSRNMRPRHSPLPLPKLWAPWIASVSSV